MGRKRATTANSNQADLLSNLIPIAVVALACMTPLVCIEGSPALGTSLPLSLAWIGLLIVWAIQLLCTQEKKIYWSTTETAATGFIVWLALSVYAVSGDGSLRSAINSFWDYNSFIIAYFLIRQTFRFDQQKKALLVTMLGISVLLSVYALYQSQVEIPGTIALYNSDPEVHLMEQGIDPSPDNPIRKQFEDRLNSSEPTATFVLTNSLAGFLATWVIVLFTLVLYSLLALVQYLLKQKERWNIQDCAICVLVLMVCVLCALLIMLCLLTTKSRTAWLALTCGMGLWLLYGSGIRHLLSWKIPAAIAGCLLIVFGSAFLFGALDLEVLSEAPKSILYRLQYWQGASGIVAERPLFGSGPGNFQNFYPKYMSPAASETVGDPHNFIVELIAIGGLPMIGILAMFTWGWIRLVRQSSESVDSSNNTQSSAEKSKGVDFHTLQPTDWLLISGCVAACMAPIFRVILIDNTWSPFQIIGTLNPFMLLGFPLSILFVFSFRRWVIEGQWPLATVVVAIVTMLINLSAAGGIGFPAVGLSLWILLALAANQPSERPKSLQKIQLSLLPLGVAILLGFVCLQTAYLPSSTANYYNKLARNTSPFSYQPVMKSLRTARHVDSYSDKSAYNLAEFYYYSWMRMPKFRENINYELNAAIALTIERNPRSFSAHQNFGKWYLSMYRKSGDAKHLELAIEHHRRSTELFPNRAILHADLAWCLHLSKQDEAAAVEAAEALRLDGLHDHSERKLGAVRLVDHANESSITGQLPLPQPTEFAEQAMLSLRNE
ncbi:MAG: hypothetical protein COA78_29795 [Blastopirellula sp.]|nr:MAG: hypothetical protein COA78_29795 [Blastopirellula sp.]